MLTIYFFYGLAFIATGAVIFIIPKKNDFLDLSDDLWLVGVFGIIHGINEWVDLFILRGGPFDIKALRLVAGLLLPVSFMFLVVFSVRIICRHKPRFRLLKLLWIACPLILVSAYVMGRGFLTAGILTRYFICMPGTFLSAFAMYIALSNSDKKQLPSVVLFSAIFTIFAFILYGFFSGLIVPDADFFPASSINYTNFNLIFGIPVQFFRMICAIFMGISFFGVAGLFYREKEKTRIKRGGIRRKFLLGICMISLVVIAVGTSLSYFWGRSLLHDTVVDGFTKMSQVLAVSVSEMIDEEIEELGAFLTDRLWRQRIREVNLAYEGLSPADMAQRFIDMDKGWEDAQTGDEFIAEYLDNEVSREMRELASETEDIAEIFITDRRGGLVASSGKTNDFYQADEEWWQYSFNNGLGRVFVGAAEFDESSGVMSIPFALPVRGEQGEVIGVCKAVVDINEFLKTLENFTMGETGHAVLVDKYGHMVFHRGLEPLSMRFCSEGDFQRLLDTKERYGLIDELHFHREKMLVAYSDVIHPVLAENGIEWKVFIDYELEEIFNPLKRLFLHMVAVICALIALLIPVGYVFSAVFVEPIEKFTDATRHITQGDLSYRVNINTKDETEELADSFNDMAISLQDSREELQAQNEKLNTANEGLAAANEELEAFRQRLERMVEEKTASLKDAQHQLIQSEKMAALGTLCAGVAHEINNPLMGAMLLAQNLKSEKENTSADHDTLEQIEEGLKRITGVVSKLLSFSRKEKLVFKDENINDIIEATLPLISHEFNLNGIALIKDYGKGLPMVTVSRNAIQQVLMNTFLNAKDAVLNSKSKKVAVATYLEEDFVRIKMKDTGCGIKKEDLTKVFDPFFTTKPVGKGLGMGMSIVRTIMDRHKGKIDIYSHEGKGTEVVLSLPCRTREA